MPLERAVGDLNQVVVFAEDNELPVDQAEMVVQDIVSRMFSDLNLSRDTQSGSLGAHMPASLMDELKVKCHSHS